jgi:Spy/CpxP family protein refolding chaperone
LKQWIRSAAVLAMGIVLVTSTAMAGPKPPPPPPPPGAVRSGPPPNANPLGLTATQQQKLQALSTKMMPELQAAMQSAKTDTERNAKLMAIQKRFEPQMMAILTKAQRTKVKAMQAEAKQKMKAAGARPNTPPKKK